jgi:hypothetical protein
VTGVGIRHTVPVSIDTITGAHIWAERFDGAIDDIFELQDQVASNVAGAIEPRLRQSEIERASRKPTASLDAYDLYLRALAQSYRYSDEGFAKAVVFARQALAIDPSYAPAAAMVGWCRGLQRLQGWGALSDEDIGEACHLARQAGRRSHRCRLTESFGSPRSERRFRPCRAVPVGRDFSISFPTA